jgi:hypothetical protein
MARADSAPPTGWRRTRPEASLSLMTAGSSASSARSARTGRSTERPASSAIFPAFMSRRPIALAAWRQRLSRPPSAPRATSPTSQAGDHVATQVLRHRDERAPLPSAAACDQKGGHHPNTGRRNSPRTNSTCCTRRSCPSISNGASPQPDEACRGRPGFGGSGHTRTETDDVRILNSGDLWTPSVWSHGGTALTVTSRGQTCFH